MESIKLQEQEAIAKESYKGRTAVSKSFRCGWLDIGMLCSEGSRVISCGIDRDDHLTISALGFEVKQDTLEGIKKDVRLITAWISHQDDRKATTSHPCTSRRSLTTY